MTTLNAIIHQPVRLRIMATLVALDEGVELDFTALREMLDLTDGNLGAHLRKLEDAKYIAVKKTFVGRKPRTFISATSFGRAAFDQHVSALEVILKS